jgi:hypothetical protein
LLLLSGSQPTSLTGGSCSWDGDWYVTLSMIAFCKLAPLLLLPPAAACCRHVQGRGIPSEERRGQARPQGAGRRQEE